MKKAIPPSWCSNGEAREGDLIVITYEQKILTNLIIIPMSIIVSLFVFSPFGKGGLRGI